MSVYEFTLEGLRGGALPLAQFAGHPLLIVNTASKCGFTPQYAGMQTLWRDRRDDGLIVLGVPSNDFGAQKPGSAAEIEEFCQINYGVDFPLAAKVPVRGKNAHPLFRWLHKEGGWLSGPRWNFYKYVIDRDGCFVTWFSSMTPPSSPRLTRIVDRLCRAGADT